MAQKDQLIKELNKMKKRAFIASPFICEKCKEISRRDNVTLFIDTIDEVIAKINTFLKDYKLVKRGSLLTEDDLVKISGALERMFPVKDGWETEKRLLKKLESLMEEAWKH